ncbi:histone-binding protein RBBP7 [Trypanosoma grayi]|uniref:histone-binding protein RBBP7 n=1 Tax=Trypanosoma grayi TaxID=71804 RepID=UPI0004F47B51|nr:histone-binding protein RBBP7 [Trypanosoma grayi]KEG13497.1 histone-binding protein RBBP7 [Trypanosoma grayi]
MAASPLRSPRECASLGTGADEMNLEAVQSNDTPTAAAALMLPPSGELIRAARLQNVWEQHLRSLYGYCAVHALEWPSLTVDWLPNRQIESSEVDYTLQYIAVGTQASAEHQNYVRVMGVTVPVEMDEELVYQNLVGCETGDVEPRVEDVNGTDAEVGSPGGSRSVYGHCAVGQTLLMEDPVLKIRAMPQMSDVIAVKTTTGFVGVYSLALRPVEVADNAAEGPTQPDLCLRGHRTGGFALSWSTVKKGFIASGADDGHVKYWDIGHRLSASNTAGNSRDRHDVQPLGQLAAHAEAVTDVCWHGSQGHLLLTAGMDGAMHLWDTRVGESGCSWPRAHEGGITAAQLHPAATYQVASAGVDGVLCLWDIRRHQKEPLATLKFHDGGIAGIQWAPFSDTVLTTFGEDGRVVVWDMAKRFLSATHSDANLAPPEVSFVHIGHLGRVTDMSWCTGQGDEWLMASTDVMNGLHVYRPLKSVVLDYIQP